jgi:hypothetical protein
MRRATYIAAALFCLVCVIALCIAPYADIPETTLKSLQLILWIMFTLFAGVFLPTGTVQLVTARQTLNRADRATPLRSILPIQTNCIQQC